MTNYENHRITMIYESIFNESLKNTLIGGVIGGGLGAIAGEVVGGDAGKRTGDELNQTIASHGEQAASDFRQVTDQAETDVNTTLTNVRDTLVPAFDNVASATTSGGLAGLAKNQMQQGAKIAKDTANKLLTTANDNTQTLLRNVGTYGSNAIQQNTSAIGNDIAQQSQKIGKAVGRGVGLGVGAAVGSAIGASIPDKERKSKQNRSSNANSEDDTEHRIAEGENTNNSAIGAAIGTGIGIATRSPLMAIAGGGIGGAIGAKKGHKLEGALGGVLGGAAGAGIGTGINVATGGNNATLLGAGGAIGGAALGAHLMSKDDKEN